MKIIAIIPSYNERGADIIVQIDAGGKYDPEGLNLRSLYLYGKQK
jgi:hypothetical protein